MATHCSRMLYEHVIVGLSKVVWIHTSFGPTIHYLSPHISFELPWFQLQDCPRKLSPEHISTPQWSMTTNLMIWGEALWSMAHLWHFQTDGSDQLLFKPMVPICFVIRASRFSIFKLHFPPIKSSRAKDMTTCGFHRSTVEIPSGLWTSEKSNLKPELPLCAFTQS